MGLEKGRCTEDSVSFHVRKPSFLPVFTVCGEEVYRKQGRELLEFMQKRGFEVNYYRRRVRSERVEESTRLGGKGKGKVEEV
ncbi:hypothetical protein M5K25_000795 [Dendrobium thyrsiflorum]|uniref:Uncharacterized protein n=1 Tax=Dendrobium thyrsiflorum TaxID=117978 RepID=A0ABD0VWR8_DENTH